MNSRHGTILIVVAGLSAILAAMALAFFVRMRSDSEENRQLTQEVQARLMLNAGLNYIGETSRIGWGEEAFGWIDIRDGGPGPRDRLGNLLYSGNASTGVGADFPAVKGKAARCAFAPMKRPPWAIKANVVYNPIPLDANLGWDQLIGHQHCDPQPVAATWSDFASGDRRTGPASTASSWFRIYRTGLATFIVTCGAGATSGFRSWAEVVTENQQDLFGSPEAFEEARRDEARFWYEVEWNQAIAQSAVTHYVPGADNYQLSGISSPRCFGGVRAGEDNAISLQFGGTFTYIQWLADEPTEW